MENIDCLWFDNMLELFGQSNSKPICYKWSKSCIYMMTNIGLSLTEVTVDENIKALVSVPLASAGGLHIVQDFTNILTDEPTARNCLCGSDCPALLRRQNKLNI